MSQSSAVKIYVLGSGSLLDEGITNMLNLQPQFNVTKIPYIDDARLHDLANLEYPYTILINEFDVRDVTRIVILLFSAPSAFARRVIVIRDRNSKLDVYDKSTAKVRTANYRRKSIVVRTKEEFIDLALRAS